MEGPIELRPVAPPPARTETAGKGNLPGLTIIRALLGWWVVAFHFSGVAPFSAYVQSDHPLLSKGLVSVDCFFILSGFILAYAHPDMLHCLDPLRFRQFLVARLARIYPVHVTVLACFALSIWGLQWLLGIRPNLPERFSLSHFTLSMLLLHGWGYTTQLSWNYPSWSLSSEWAAYILAPVIFVISARIPLRAVPLLCLACLIVAVLWINAPPIDLTYSVPRVVLGFSLGVLLLRLRIAHDVRLSGMRATLLVAGGLGMGLLAGFDQKGLFVAGFCLLVLGLSFFPVLPPGPVGRILSYLGATSFAVYMVHALIQGIWIVVARHVSVTNHLLVLVSALLLVLTIQAAASLLHHCVENPARRYITRRA